MEYIINQNQEAFKIVMFEYDLRNWEICFESNKTEEEIQELILLRIEDLVDEYLIHGNYNYSDLFVDYIDYNDYENNI
jgi:hypothetical protein